ncbi:MAG: bifunctional diguanylate cyclase/phosphodiesterase, partial [Pseudomonadota bacterium]
GPVKEAGPDTPVAGNAASLVKEGSVGVGGEGVAGAADPWMRLAHLVMGALDMPIGLVDRGDGPPVIATRLALPAETIAAAWAPPAAIPTPVVRRCGGNPATPQGAVELRTVLAAPLPVSGGHGWIAGLDIAPRDVPHGAEATLSLLAELATPLAGAEPHRSPADAFMDAGTLERMLGAGTVWGRIDGTGFGASRSALTILGSPMLADLNALVGHFAPFDQAFVRRAFVGKSAGGRHIDFERELIQPSTKARRWVRVKGEINDETGEIFAAVVDITAERLHRAEIERLARHDPLTGSLSRSMFDDALTEALARSDRDRSRTGLFLFDIDDFKDINDTFGHGTGDDLLRHVASELREATRSTDLVIRLAGDEFAVLLPDSSDDVALVRLAKQIQRSITGQVSVGSKTVQLSCTVGVAIYPDDMATRVDLYRAADQALTEAKDEGRGTVRRFHPRMRERREESRRFLAEVKRGLINGEFVPFFQPKINLRTGDVVGFEALCRWRHPERGVQSPGVFHEAFADREVGGELSDVALNGSFAAASEMSHRGLPFGHIAINLNAQQLQRAGLVSQVERLRDSYGVATDQIAFEVVENVLIRDKRVVYNNLMELNDMGFSIALDDFGTGFASLSHIREPFIREVKIDRSFVTNSGVSSDDRQIVSAIIQMARKMGLTMVAEGIEDEETLKHLRALGCSVGQGYAFAAALPFEEAAAFLSRQRRIFTLLEEVQETPSLSARVGDPGKA